MVGCCKHMHTHTYIGLVSKESEVMSRSNQFCARINFNLAVDCVVQSYLVQIQLLVFVTSFSHANISDARLSFPSAPPQNSIKTCCFPLVFFIDVI